MNDINPPTPPAYNDNDPAPIIHPIHTSCGDCIFSEKDKKTQTQIGCNFNKIETYRNKNDEDVVEVFDEFGNEFFVINNHICLHKRTKDWAKDYAKNQWMPMVEEQLKIKYHAMVIFREGYGTEDLLRTMDSFNSQKIPPSLLTIISRSKMAASSLAISIEEGAGKPRFALFEPDDMKEEPPQVSEWQFPWRLQTFLDDELIDREAIDIVVDSSKSITYPIFYIVFEAPFEVPPTLSEELQDYFVNKMKHAVFANPTKDGNGMLVNSAFHHKHAGNCFGINIEDKLKEFEPGAAQYIRNIEDLCPSLKL